MIVITTKNRFLCLIDTIFLRYKSLLLACCKVFLSRRPILADNDQILVKVDESVI